LLLLLRLRLRLLRRVHTVLRLATIVALLLRSCLALRLSLLLLLLLRWVKGDASDRRRLLLHLELLRNEVAPSVAET